VGDVSKEKKRGAPNANISMPISILVMKCVGIEKTVKMIEIMVYGFGHIVDTVVIALPQKEKRNKIQNHMLQLRRRIMEEKLRTLKVRIPLGINSDYRYISKDFIEKALKNSKHVPLIDYRKEATGIPIGVAMKDLEFDNDANLLVGEFFIWGRGMDKPYFNFDNSKYDIELSVVKSHKAEGRVILDEVRVICVTIERRANE